jgi:hypothetical protein
MSFASRSLSLRQIQRAESVSGSGQAVHENDQIQTVDVEGSLFYSPPEWFLVGPAIIRAVGSQIKTIPNLAESHPSHHFTDRYVQFIVPCRKANS